MGIQVYIKDTYGLELDDLLKVANFSTAKKEVDVLRLIYDLAKKIDPYFDEIPTDSLSIKQWAVIREFTNAIGKLSEDKVE